MAVANFAVAIIIVSGPLSPKFAASFNVPIATNHQPRLQQSDCKHVGFPSRCKFNSLKAVEDTFLEDVDGIGETTVTSRPALTSETTSVDMSTNTEILSILSDEAQTAGSTEVAEEMIGTVLMDTEINGFVGSNEANAVDIATSNGILSTLSDDAQLVDPTAVVEEIIGTALMDNGGGGPYGNDETSPSTPETTAVDISTTDGILSTLSDDAQLVDPTTVVEEIIGTALLDTDSYNPLSKSETKEGKGEVKEEIIPPTLAKIIKFAIPAVGVWLCSPLLSLIDTSSVGLLSGTAQQAALYPAVSVTDYSALLVAFMYTATTNLVAGAHERENNSEEKPQTSNSLIKALQLSGFVGAALGSVLMLFGRQLLKGIIGNDAIDPAIFSAALKYVRIRALGMPAAVIIGSAQSACLGMQDIRSPLFVLLTAAIVNFLGDVLFVPLSSPWFGGASGAAWATVFSQYSALFLFLKWLTTKPKPPTVNLTSAILELTGKSDEGKPRRKNFRKALKALSFQTKSENSSTESSAWRSVQPLKYFLERKEKKKNEKSETSFSTRGFLSGKFRTRNLLHFPKDAKEFWPYFIPVTTTSVGRVSTYVAMGHVVSSSLGTLSMAVNQIILSVFYCLTPVADSLNLTAQTFIPGIFEKDLSRNRSMALRQAIINFMKAGVIFGAGMASAVAVVPFIGGAFTADPMVLAKVNEIAPLLACVFSLHGLICAGEGLLLGQKDLGFLGKAYAAFFAAVPYFMLRIKRAVLDGSKTAGLTSLWKVFFVYQCVRLGLWVFRLNQLNHEAMTPNSSTRE